MSITGNKSRWLMSTDQLAAEMKNGGVAIVDVPTREAALEWAAKFAAACRCAQEVRSFGFDPLV